MRELTDHKLAGLNEALTIIVTDKPGHGGASHNYSVSLGNGTEIDISFQNGPIQENGVNGISQEVLLAIVIDRLRSFQAGQYCCRENAIALTKTEEALMWLQKRTRDRLARGVEGTSAK